MEGRQAGEETARSQNFRQDRELLSGLFLQESRRNLAGQAEEEGLFCPGLEV